jgi:hypothetical protein
MDTPISEVLYYPNFKADDLTGIKQSLLLYDRVTVIAPASTPLMGTLLADSSGAELSNLRQSGALSESWSIYPGNSVLGSISDVEIIRKRRDEFITALLEDLEDPNVLAWETQFKRIDPQRSVSWFVLPSYFDDNPPNISKPGYQIEEIYHPGFGRLFRVPFLVGMSFGLSEALWAAVDRGYTLFTDDSASQDFLMLRLKRGWKRLTQDPELQKSFRIEKEFAEKFAVASLGAWFIRSKVPQFVKNASNYSLSDVLKLREDSDKKDALKYYRDGLSSLVMSEELWNVPTFRDFQGEASRIMDQKIKPAFEALEGRRVDLRDVFGAIDAKDAASEVIKAAPDLFVGAAVTSGVAATAALGLWGHTVAPHALLALGCGLTAHFAAKLIDNVNERLTKHRNAQFLTYPLRLRKTLDSR